MFDNKKSITLSLVITYIALALLAVATITLPWLVTWYVEIKGRPATLPTIIMVTCYPCVPFAAAALLSLRRILLNLKKDNIFILQNLIMQHRISWCCIFISVITLFAGRSYLPFFIVSISMLFFALLMRIVKNIFQSVIERDGDETAEPAEISAEN